jgi:agmatine deiminase
MTEPVYIPHEAAPHAAIWTAFPSHEHLWQDDLPRAQAQAAQMVQALAGLSRVRGDLSERVFVLVDGEAARTAASAWLADCATIVDARFGDIWLRDTGPIFARRGGRQTALRPRFNGWGGKYDLPGDEGVSAFVAGLSKTPVRDVDLTIEGGALEFDGEGTVLTTRECLLNPNRNPGLSEGEAERRLRMAFGVRTVLWLDRGLLNDHTDGHIDNVARFVAPGLVVCQSPAGPDDPHRERLEEARAQLEAMTDAKGRRLKIVALPAPGFVPDADGDPAPASHMNYVIGNESVVVPVYGTPTQDAATAKLAELFPGRRVSCVAANALLTGGGSFHCITQHQPTAAALGIAS